MPCRFRGDERAVNSNSFSTFQTRAIFWIIIMGINFSVIMPYNVDVFVSCIPYLFNFELHILEFYDVLKIGLYIYRLKISTQATRCDLTRFCLKVKLVLIETMSHRQTFIVRS